MSSQHSSSGGGPSTYDTTVLSTSGSPKAAAHPHHPVTQIHWNSGADLGLLILRLVLGGTFLAHGLQKLFGLFGGPGVSGFADGLASYGYRAPNVLALVAGITETAGGALVVLGLFTPLATAALLGIMVNAIWLKYGNGFFVSPNSPGGIELDVLLGGLAAGITLTGPGRLALDKGRVWFRHPVAIGWICLLLGVGAGVLSYLLLRT
ncbi:MAG: DoxX family protein [Actinomycetota bacterium]|nr:DoxX family protein [Actinomycetota bacterium]